MRKIQNRVSEFEALFRIISEYAQVGYANYNLYNKEGYAQNVWLRNYGEADSAQIVDVIGKYRHIHPEDRKPLLDLLTRFSAGEVQSATAICRVQHDDGRKTWIKTHLICRDYRPGEQVIYMLGINYDITALKQTEQELIAAKGLRQAVSEITSIPATDPVIEEIAAACGFGSATYFATVFKGIMGMTPSAFRHSLHG